jgi:hypothetical protein
MQKVNGAAFYRAATSLKSLEALLGQTLQEKSKAKRAFLAEKIDDKYKTNMLNLIGTLNAQLTVLGAILSAVKVDKFGEELLNDRCTWEKGHQFMKYINDRLQDELDRVALFAMDTERVVKYYEPREPLFGQEFADKFSTNGVFELDEAAKCFALGRPTAAVFHLMRLMEVGLRATARCLGINDPAKPAERNWGVILKSIKTGYETKWPNAQQRISGDFVLFEALQASLDAVKSAWRNTTMHIENKYTDEEAEHIFIAVKGFMKNLAGRCDENGEPKA